MVFVLTLSSIIYKNYLLTLCYFRNIEQAKTYAAEEDVGQICYHVVAQLFRNTLKLINKLHIMDEKFSRTSLVFYLVFNTFRFSQLLFFFFLVIFKFFLFLWKLPLFF